MPSHGGEFVAFFCIPGPVALYFCLPEVHVAFGEDTISATIMAVPEASVYEDDGPVLAEDEVGMTWQTWMIEPIAKATAEQELPDQQLWFGVLAPYRRHATVPLFFREFVHLVGRRSHCL